MIKRIYLLIFLITSSLFSVEIPTSYAKTRPFVSSIELNAQVIQLSNAKQSIMSLVGGYIEAYYVQPGQKVKNGEKIARIKSIMLSKMTAEYISLKKQFVALNKNYEATKKLYKKGMTSMQDLNIQTIQKNAMSAKLSTLQSQLSTLGIDAQSLKKASADYILYAHSSGRVSNILQSLHTVISADTPIVSIVKSQAYYIKSFLPLQYASKVKLGQKIVVKYADKEIVSYITQILPELDTKTQRIIVLSSINEKTDDLYINAYIKSTLYLQMDREYVAVKKSALSFFNNEWVVFVPKEEHGHDKEHVDYEYEEHQKHQGDDHDKEEHEEIEVPYEARVVEVVIQDDTYAGILGLEANEAYVSDKSYYIKSMMLKSSLGDGD